ncbi:MAG: exopolysaccharide biosynthesis polyprenyl glycosylphosphotransferase [Gemmatimonadaceae bacterium]
MRTALGHEWAMPPELSEVQARAFANLRTHLVRSSLRVAALLAADVAAFLLLRSSVRTLRYAEVLPAQASAFIQWLFAQGYLGGWQFAAALLTGLLVTGTYGPGDVRRDPRRLFTACALGAALPLWAGLWSAAPFLTAGRFVATVAIVWPVLLLTRNAFDFVVRRYAPHPRASARTILVGAAGECLDMKGRAALTGRQEFRVLGFVDTHVPAAAGALGSIAALNRVLHDLHVDTVIVCGYVDESTFLKVVKSAVTGECQLLIGARRFELAGFQPAVVWRRKQPFVELRRVALRGRQLILKRLLDVTVSALALAVTAPLLLCVGAAIAVESRGGAIFRQRRLGRHGRVFWCYKFRTMYANAEQRLQSDPELYQRYVENDYKLPCAMDARITRLGRFLRRTSLDELPQLVNVLLGDMSLVGPRPIVPEEIQHYNGEGLLLLSLKPGMTGAWQVSGRSSLAYPERAVVELEYVERWSLASDIWILLRTVPAVLAQRGAS